MKRCLADASFKTYDSAWHSWQRCADFYGFNVDLMAPDGKTPDGKIPLPLATCANLIDLYIGFECGLRQIKPTSIARTYIPGISKHFVIHSIRNHFKAAAYDDSTQTLLDGYIRIWNEKFPEGQKAKIPFTLVLALEAERLLKAGSIAFAGFATTGPTARAAIDAMRLTCALLFGIFFLLRKGEFLPPSDNQRSAHHPLLRRHLRFLDVDHNEIPYHCVGITRASWLTITIEFSKTDQSGCGRIVTHHIDVDNPLSCIVQRMEAYIALSRLFGATSDLPLFDIPGFSCLTSYIITALMRRTCQVLGLPFDRISAHSLRYGGATTLAAAGFPEYVIAFYGGWVQGSRAMRKYIKPTPAIIKRVSLHMTQASASLTVQQTVNQILAARI